MVLPAVLEVTTEFAAAQGNDRVGLSDINGPWPIYKIPYTELF